MVLYYTSLKADSVFELMQQFVFLCHLQQDLVMMMMLCAF